MTTLNIIFEICIDCLIENKGYVWIYIIIIFAIWLLRLDSSPNRGGMIDRAKLPRFPADFTLQIVSQSVHRFIAPRLEKVLKQTGGLLRIFHIRTLFFMAQALVAFLKCIYGNQGDRWDYIRAFKVAIIFYLIVVPLPAAFMPPVGGHQASPDYHLLTATILLIVVNAVGDAVSVNITIWNYKRAIIYGTRVIGRAGRKDDAKGDIVPFNARGEFYFYLRTMLDLFYASLSLIAVLVVSNVLFGVQIGQYKFAFDPETLSMMRDRAMNFWDLRAELYWFRGDTKGVFGYPGIPGMFFFAITTYLPTIFVATAALIWAIMLPIRILFASNMNSVTRLALSQAVMLTYCVVYFATVSTNFGELYGFLITK